MSVEYGSEKVTEGGTPDVDGDKADAPTTTGPRRPWRSALAADLRGAIPDASLALVLSVLVFVVLWWRVENERSETIKLMPTLTGTEWMPYYALQAVGWAALWWSWATVILGLLVAGGRPGWLRVKTRTIEKVHRTTSLTVIGFTFVHIALMVWSRISNDNWGILRAIGECFVPWFWSGTFLGRFAIFIGLVAFYGAIILGISYYFRHMIGVRAWRFAHRFSILVYVLAVWHTFIYGTNVWFTGYQRTALWVMQLPIAYLALARLLAPLRRSERLPLKPRELAARLDLMTVLRLGVRLIAAAAIVLLAGIVVLDRTGGREHPAEYPTAEHMEHDAAGGE